MPLTNTQYDQIMRGYQDRQLKRQQLIDTRREEIAAKIPKITESIKIFFSVKDKH